MGISKDAARLRYKRLADRIHAATAQGEALQSTARSAHEHEHVEDTR